MKLREKFQYKFENKKKQAVKKDLRRKKSNVSLSYKFENKKLAVIIQREKNLI